MSDLLDRIRRAQIEAGERVVMEDLKSKGLDAAILDAVRNPTGECICPKCGLRHGTSNVDGGF